MIDDVLYGTIKAEGSKRYETVPVTEHLTIEYEITHKGGEDHHVVKSVTVKSHNNMTVTVDGRTIVQPTPPVYDDYCYLLEIQEVREIRKDLQPSTPTRVRRNAGEWGLVRNQEWTPSDMGYVGWSDLYRFSKLHQTIQQVYNVKMVAQCQKPDIEKSYVEGCPL